ncbi:MAG TPA: hypothetical protein VK395_03175 [Gemmataceae bacterium]|nr:hypothetical protein [Gemmataceae bacterium]
MVEWIAPVFTAYENRTTISEFLSAGLNLFLGQRTAIAITGVAGVGKTVLLDYLCGKGYHAQYKVPPQSQKLERPKLRNSGKRLSFLIVPGQLDAGPRGEALDKVFRNKKCVHGIIHVAAYGYASVRGESSRRILLEDLEIDDIEKYRAYHLEQEIRELQETCRAIVDSHRKRHTPSWLLLAVDKVDLYHDQLVSSL